MIYIHKLEFFLSINDVYLSAKNQRKQALCGLENIRRVLQDCI